MEGRAHRVRLRPGEAADVSAHADLHPSEHFCAVSSWFRSDVAVVFVCRLMSGYSATDSQLDGIVGRFYGSLAAATSVHEGPVDTWEFISATLIKGRKSTIKSNGPPRTADDRTGELWQAAYDARMADLGQAPVPRETRLAQMGYVAATCPQTGTPFYVRLADFLRVAVRFELTFCSVWLTLCSPWLTVCSL